jgi:hypothetical protein
MCNRVATITTRHLGLLASLAAAMLASSAMPAMAQVLTGGFIGRAVGGISIDADGVLANAERDNLNKLRELRAQGLDDVHGDRAESV